MLKCCGNYDAIWPIMLHLYTKNVSTICQRTYIVGVKTWIIKTWCTLYLLRIDISVSGPSGDIIQVDELDAIGIIYIHLVLELCSHDMQLDHTLFGEIPYYISIMPWFKSCWLCSKLCCHNICKLNTKRIEYCKLNANTVPTHICCKNPSVGVGEPFLFKCEWT